MAPLMQNRRGFITGLAALVAAPALVRAGSLMPVKVIDPMLLAPEAMTFHTSYSLLDPGSFTSFFKQGGVYYRVMEVGDYGRAAHCLRADVAERLLGRLGVPPKLGTT